MKGEKNKKYRMRWFTAKKDAIEYYKDCKASKPLGAIVLGSSVTRTCKGDSKVHQVRGFLLGKSEPCVRQLFSPLT